MESNELSKKRSKPEYSKVAVAALIVLWFVGAVFGMVIVAFQIARDSYSVDLGELLMYIGGPMTGGIVGYLLKSAFENREKIRCLPRNDAQKNQASRME